MATGKIPRNPLQKIALSCSGGGYRAAAFHLGAMSYMNRLQYNGKPLLENVKMISTVSGGTITGIIYALQKQKGASFKEIYDFILQKLHSIDLIKSGIVKLNPDGEWKNPYKHKNLINAFAELYDEHLTKGATFAELSTMKSHLEVVVFNSTEFNNGINFRFRNKGTGYFGNFEIRIPEAAAEEVKLGDAMASSSCFPGGFEPMIWPQDFIHEKAEKLKALVDITPPIGLMDGGIYDNQGIESILNHKINSTEPYFDLVIISDVASPYMKAYQPMGDRPKTGLRALTLETVHKRIKKVNVWISLALVLLAGIFGALPLITSYSNSLLTGFSLGLSAGFLIMFIIKVVLVKKIRGMVRGALEKFKKALPSFYIDKLSNLKIEKLSVRRIEPLLIDRINSLVTLLMDVFLKVVRRLNYYKLYNNERYSYRRMTNLIKELTEVDFGNRVKRKKEDDPRSDTYWNNTVLKGGYADVVGPKIKEVSEDASSFGTTLWFTEDEMLNKMLDKLLATGQFTMCYNMLYYLETVIWEEGNGFEQLDAATQANLKLMYQQCKDDWAKFKTEPMFLCAEMSSKS